MVNSLPSLELTLFVMNNVKTIKDKNSLAIKRAKVPKNFVNMGLLIHTKHVMRRSMGS
jgi:hypothetical protein